MGIHFVGLVNLEKPAVWVFPQLSACLDCGFTEFVIPEKELHELKALDSDQGMSVGRA